MALVKLLSSSSWSRRVLCRARNRNGTSWEVVKATYLQKNYSNSLDKESSHKHSDKPTEKHRDAEKEPLPEWPDGVNPHTGEKGGPKGPEPTRYGDWERKGRVTDF
jgi:hypothetical protein